MQIVYACFIIGCLAAVLYTPHKLFLGVKLINEGRVLLPMKLASWIPVYNTIASEKEYKGNCRSLAVAYASLASAIILRIVSVKVAPDAAFFAVSTVVLLYATIVYFYASNAVFVFQILHESDCLPLWAVIVMAVLTPIGQEYIGSYLPAKIASVLKEERTF